jgi:hypothetical protein
MSPEIGAAVAWSSKDPSPSWPRSLLPQQRTRPPSSSLHEWRPPAAIFDRSLGNATAAPRTRDPLGIADGDVGDVVLDVVEFGGGAMVVGGGVSAVRDGGATRAESRRVADGGGTAGIVAAAMARSESILDVAAAGVESWCVVGAAAPIESSGVEPATTSEFGGVTTGTTIWR